MSASACSAALLELLGDLVGDDLGHVDGLDVSCGRLLRQLLGRRLGRLGLARRLLEGLGPGPAALDAVAAGLRRRAGAAPAGGRLASWRAWTTSRRSSLKRATTTVMWHVRLRMRVARPRARGRKRRSVGPSSAKQASTNSSSASCSSLCTALATALARTLRMSLATSRVVNCRISSARRTSRPRIRSRTSRALDAEPRRYLAVALVPGGRRRPATRPRSASWPSRSACRPFAPRSWPAWNRKVRVGLNSPSLCPTIDSVMYTGTCLRPSWTAIVWPTISGMIVERRDQVLMTRRSPACVLRVDLLQQVVVDERALLQAARHGLTSDPCRCGAGGR